MARYNHFALEKYVKVCFGSLAVGEKFRKDFRKNGRRRSDIICVKTGELTYEEFKSKQQHSFPNSAFDVRDYATKVG